MCSDVQNFGMSYKGGQEGALSVPVLHVVHPRPWRIWLHRVCHAAWCSGAVLQLARQVDVRQLFRS